MVNATANNAYILMKTCERYSKSKKCFLKNLNFQLAKSAVENRLRLPKQKYSVRNAAAQVGLSIPTESTLPLFLLYLAIKQDAEHARNGSTTTDRDKLAANNADWLRRAILNIFLLSPKPSCPNPHFRTKSLRRNR